MRDSKESLSLELDIACSDSKQRKDVFIEEILSVKIQHCSTVLHSYQIKWLNY